MTKVYDYLMENGPSDLQSVYHPSSDTRIRENICRFKLSSSPVTVSTSPGTRMVSVYYISGVHTRKEVLRAFNEINDGILVDLPSKSLIQRISPEFRDAAIEEFDLSFDNVGGAQGNSGGVCPHCGEAYEGQLPTHLLHYCKKQ